MKIEIKGVEFSNKGAELMLLSIIAELAQRRPDIEVVLTPGFLLPYEKRARLGTWQKFSFKLLGLDWTWLGNLAPRPVRRLLRHFGIVVEKDIDLVLDASGFVYSDQWGSHRLAESVAHINRIDKQGKAYIFMPQAFGPFKQQKNARLMNTLIEKAKRVYARDDGSLQALKEVRSQDNIVYYPDITTILDVSSVELSMILPDKYACVIPNNKMIKDKPEAIKQQYLQLLTQAIEQIAKLGLTPILLNHEGTKDAKLCELVMANSEVKPLFITDVAALEVKKIIGSSVFNLSSRFHGCVSSLSQGVPTLATSWGHKYEQLFGQYQCQDNIVGMSIEPQLLAQKIQQLVDDHQNIAAALAQCAQLQKQQTETIWSEIIGFLPCQNR